jgi:hypothetical protein
VQAYAKLKRWGGGKVKGEEATESRIVATIMRIVVTKQHTAAKLGGKYLNAIHGISFGRIRMSWNAMW